MLEKKIPVLAGLFGGDRAMFSEVATPPDDTANSGAVPAAVRGSRRRKLWEIPHRFHCPVIGVCFDCDELRRLMNKVMHLPRDASDFLLHTTAVGNCDARTHLAEILHKHLERRFQLLIRQHAAIKTAESLQQAWKAACKDGRNIPALLWVCWTHPACNEVLEQEIYGDIHMIQHQLGAHARVDHQAMQAAQVENASLLRRIEEMQVELAALRREKAEQVDELTQVIVALRADLVARDAQDAGAARELALLRESMHDLGAFQHLSGRLQTAEAEARSARLRADKLMQEVIRLRDFAKYAEETIESLTREDDSFASLADSHLSGKCVLCVGGRSGAVNSYREVVEQSGGCFLHHDGGLEESMHRIDGVVAAADVVICQAGCISHNAYWRVKEHCKRTGKPCMFVKSGGVSSFGRAVSELNKKI